MQTVDRARAPARTHVRSGKTDEVSMKTQSVAFYGGCLKTSRLGLGNGQGIFQIKYFFGVVCTRARNNAGRGRHNASLQARHLEESSEVLKQLLHANSDSVQARDALWRYLCRRSGRSDSMLSELREEVLQ